MRFTVSWVGDPDAKSSSQRNRLPITSVEVGFANGRE
jgi:hypothetical protein